MSLTAASWLRNERMSTCWQLLRNRRQSLRRASHCLVHASTYHSQATPKDPPVRVLRPQRRLEKKLERCSCEAKKLGCCSLFCKLTHLSRPLPSSFPFEFTVRFLFRYTCTKYTVVLSVHLIPQRSFRGASRLFSCSERLPRGGHTLASMGKRTQLS